MAITATIMPQMTGNPNIRMFTITNLDADIGPTYIPHGLRPSSIAGNNIMIWITPAISLPSTAIANWCVTWDNTNMILQKQSAVGSGGGTPGTTLTMTIYAMNIHSLIA